MSRTSSPASILSGPILISLSFGTLAFWFIGIYFDMYSISVVGAIYELLWLPFLVLLFGIPIISLAYWIKEKFSPKSLYFFSLLISGITIFLMILGG